MSLLDEYYEKIKLDTKIDDFNLKSAQLALPGKKHFWAAKLIFHKKELNDLIKARKNKINELVKIILDKSPVELNRSTAEKRVVELPEIKAMDDRIQDLGYVIELLDKTEQIFKAMSFDIKNIIEINKLEQL